jgi:hypothetical protein
MKKYFILRTKDGREIRAEWPDIEPTGEVENGQKLFRLIRDGTEGFKITGAMMEVENRADAQIMWDWLSESGDPDSRALDGLEALIESLS